MAVILSQLQAETFLRGGEHHAEIASTNDRALQLCADAALRTPFLVLADHQSSGRGRGANRWWSSDGALMFSVIVDANDIGLPESRWPQVSLTVGATVCEVLRQLTSHSVGLKWPNDVWLSGRKVCGILVEVPPVQRGRLVIGVGLNVNNSFAAAPPELEALATSLREESGREFERQPVLAQLLRQLDEDLRQLTTDGPSMAERWQTHCVLRDRTVSLEVSRQLVKGRCLGIADDGALRLQTPAGEQSFYGGIVQKIE